MRTKTSTYKTYATMTFFGCAFGYIVGPVMYLEVVATCFGFYMLISGK